MLSLADFKKLVAEDIKNLSEKEIESLYCASISFANFAFKKWTDEKIKKTGEK